MSEKVYIRDLSDSALKATVKLALFTIGVPKIKIEGMDGGEVNTVLKGVRKFQGSMWIDSFEQAFHEYAAGNLDVRINNEPGPHLIGKICKAYKETLNTTKREPQQPDKWYASEMEWKTFVNRVKVYGLIMPETLWIRYWNYLVTRNKITGTHPVENWSDYIEKNAEAEVREFIYANYESYLHDNNLFKGKSGKGNLGIGEKLKRTIGV